MWYRDLDHLSDDDYAREAEVRLSAIPQNPQEYRAEQEAYLQIKRSLDTKREILAKVMEEPENSPERGISALYELGLVKWKVVYYQSGPDNRIQFKTRRGPYELTERGQSVLDGKPLMATVVNVFATDAEIIKVFRPYLSRKVPDDLDHIKMDIVNALCLYQMMEPFRLWANTKDPMQGIYSGVKIHKVLFAPIDAIVGKGQKRFNFTKLVFTDDELFVEFRLLFSGYQLECREVELSDVE